MNVNCYERLEGLYNAISPSLGRNELDERVRALSIYLHQNSNDLAMDLVNHQEHAGLYQRIAASNDRRLPEVVQTIEQKSKLLQLAATPEKLMQWFGEGDFNPENLLTAIESLKHIEEIAPIVSKLVVIAFGLKEPKQVNSLFKGRNMQLTALAHLVNENKIPLKELNLSMEDLNLIAPHLQYVNSRDIAFKDEKEVEDFLNKCSYARHLMINSDKMVVLKRIPTKVQTLDCSNCKALQDINFSNNFNLKELDCSHCEALQQLNCFCESLKKIDCSNCQKLKQVICFGSTRLTQLEISNCGALQKLDCSHCLELKELNLIGCGALTILDCQEGDNLTKIDCSGCQALSLFYCHTCPKLETIVSTGLPNCTFLNHSDCPLLSQLPQLPPGATVYSHNSINFINFEVDPEDLKTKPVEVLKHLGEAISQYKRMPNIVYLNSPGIDVGGLRRQLVTTLLQNQFPNEAYQTIGMLIALAALGSLPLGRVLPNHFYFAMLQLDEEPLNEKKIQSLALYGIPDEEIDTVDHNLTWSIFLAAKGFREITDPKPFREMPLQDFVNKVAGLEVNWENFEKLALFKDAKIKGYFKTFFEKKPQLIVDMIELFTGSRALGVENIKIIVEDEQDKGRLFVIETCFQQVKLPPYDTYELFEEKLLKTMEYTMGHFGKE